MQATGFRNIPSKEQLYAYFLPCPAGTFTNSFSQGAEGCIPCSPGGYYSDTVGYVGTGCKKCPNGTFVAFNKAPATQPQDCKTCPRGTDGDLFAGHRACTCLEGYFRTDMFERCHKCREGLNCQDEYATLKSGYWWRWKNETRKDRYKVFVANLMASSAALGKDDVQYPYPLPIPYKCPEEKSCKGGMDSSCEDGYGGPLCSVCSKGHFKQIHQCSKCPSKALMVGQLLIVVSIVLIIVAICAWTMKRRNKENEGERSLIDTFLSKIKIVIGFYQVTYGLLEAFSYIEWPQSLRVISKYSQILQLDILQIAPLHCLFSGLRSDAFANLFSIMAINAAIVLFAGVVYWARKVVISRNVNLEDEEKSKKISQIKEAVYRNLFFFMYITYLSTCSKTATVLPLACRELCMDEKEGLCLEYLKADYSVQCRNPWYNKLVIVAYLSMAYIICLPTATFIALWKQRRTILDTSDTDESEEPGSNTEIIKGLLFLHENYKSHAWFWELVEMSRKVIVTSGLILIGQESRSYIGLAWVIAGMYGILFAWNHPIQNAFENILMTVSIAVTVFNLGVGAVSKIPTENLPGTTDSYIDAVIFNILVLGANTLVIGLLAFQYVIHLYGYLKEWRKNPQWSFSCCLAMILPLISLPGDISGVVGTNVINNQLDTGDIEMPTIVATVQDSGAIDITPEDGEEGDNNPTEAPNDNRGDVPPQTGENEVSTNATAMQEIEIVNNAIKINDNPTEERDANRSDAQTKNGETKGMPIIVAFMQDSVETQVTTEKCEKGKSKAVEVRDGNRTDPRPKNGKKRMPTDVAVMQDSTIECHQGTQTELYMPTIPSIADDVVHEPV